MGGCRRLDPSLLHPGLFQFNILADRLNVRGPPRFPFTPAVGEHDTPMHHEVLLMNSAVMVSLTDTTTLPMSNICRPPTLLAVPSPLKAMSAPLLTQVPCFGGMLGGVNPGSRCGLTVVCAV